MNLNKGPEMEAPPHFLLGCAGKKCRHWGQETALVSPASFSDWLLDSVNARHPGVNTGVSEKRMIPVKHSLLN